MHSAFSGKLKNPHKLVTSAQEAKYALRIKYYCQCVSEGGLRVFRDKLDVCYYFDVTMHKTCSCDLIHVFRLDMTSVVD